MAEKKKTHSHTTYLGGEMGLGTIMLIFIVAIFILWVLSGANERNQSTKLLEKSPIYTPTVKANN